MSWTGSHGGGSQDAVDLSDHFGERRRQPGTTGQTSGPSWTPHDGLTSAVGAGPAHGSADGLRTVWTRAQGLSEGSAGGSATSPGPGPRPASPSASPSPPLSASSSESNTSLLSEANRPSTSSKGSAVPSAVIRKGRGRGRRGPPRCKRCGRFLKKESWLRSLTRTVSKTLTPVTWGRRRVCSSCGRAFRRTRGYLVRAKYSRRLGRPGRVSSRARPARAKKRRSKRGQRSTQSRKRSVKRKRRRRSIDDHKFFVC